MLTNLNQGYAVAGCDGGHSLADSGNNTPFAPYLEDPAKVRAWIHDSIAMTTAVTRSLTADYYSRHPRYSYYYGCSTGGAQGYALAQFHPELFDGIYAGSPGNWYSHLILSFLWNGLQTQGDRYMSQDVLNFVTDKVVAACDEIDGVIDGLIEDPQKCLFDITALECKAGQYPVKENNTIVCMTTEQIKAAQAIYQGPKDVRAGKEIYPGFSLGSENGWLGQETMLYPRYAAPILKELVFNDSNYNISQFNWGTDIDVVDRNASPLIDEISPDLSHFQRRGGKLISTQGWADQYNAATWPIQHLMQIRQVMTHADFIELFMVPGGGHCGSNPNYPHVPATYHVLDELVPWVEKGIKPVQMLSSGAPDGTDTTRKLCPYPKTANFVGNDQNDWNSYTCT
jgi:feruloyl esterase